MVTVRVEPDGLVFEASPGQTVMGAAQDAGLYWPTTCGGQGICTSCACSVSEGAGNLDPIGRSELRTLAQELGETAVHARNLRLACQARVQTGPVVVAKRGVRPIGD